MVQYCPIFLTVFCAIFNYMLELRSLVKEFAGVPAVRGVDLQIADGEFFALLGPSGCGKTTLLRLLAGFESPTSGMILQDGVRIDHLPPNRRSFNMVFQRYALFPHLDVRGNIEFGLRMKRVTPAERRTRVDEALALVRLEGLANRPIHTLSGGQQQRVALARALVNRPRTLLLDEPLSALDLKLRQQMQVELRSIQRRVGQSFVFVTHDQEEALTLADRVAVMNEGRVEQVGTPREIYENPQTSFVARFIGSANFWDGQFRREGGRGFFRLSGGTEFSIEPDRVATVVASREGAAQLMVRPERVRIRAQGAEASSATQSFEGRVRDLIYRGSYTDYWIDCPAFPGQPVLAAVPTGRPGAHAHGTAVGDAVFVEWSSSDGLLVSEAKP
jgi:spermidine/putrescine ABC transporter ATP-binding subunit